MIYQCTRCGSDFKRSPKYAARSTRLFCSMACVKAERKGDAVYHCALCGDEFEREKNRAERSKNVYCTKECAAIARIKDAS